MYAESLQFSDSTLALSSGPTTWELHLPCSSDQSQALFTSNTPAACQLLAHTCECQGQLRAAARISLALPPGVYMLRRQRDSLRTCAHSAVSDALGYHSHIQHVSEMEAKSQAKGPQVEFSIRWRRLSTTQSARFQCKLSGNVCKTISLLTCYQG